QLVHEPHHLLHIEGAAAAEDLEHAIPCWRHGENLAGFIDCGTPVPDGIGHRWDFAQPPASKDLMTDTALPESLLAHLRRAARDAPDSGIVEAMDYGRRRGGVMGLWAGEGDLSTPAFISDAAARALAAGETFYTWQRGIPELREALARYHARVYGRTFAAEGFFVTGSGMQAIQITLALTAGDGDEVIIPTPTWPNAAAATGVIGARPIAVPMTFGN